MSRNIYLSLAVFALLPLAGGTASAQSSFIHQAENPFDNNSDGLPDLGMAPESRAGEKHFAEMVKAFGEASMTDNGLDTGEQAKQFAFGQVRDRVSEQVNQQLESWLSPWGNASVGLQVDNDLRGPFNMVSPYPVHNEQFAHALGHALHRPAIFRVPAAAIRLLMGESAVLVLGGQRALPKRLEAAGFAFRWYDLDEALKDVLS